MRLNGSCVPSTAGLRRTRQRDCNIRTAQTNAPSPVMARPTISVLISRVPS